MIISLIAAIGANNELGRENKLLWELPADMAHFRSVTSGHTVIMGRKTYESIGHPLPNRRNIVVTSDAAYSQGKVETATSFTAALQLASLDQGKKFEEVDEEIEVFVIGGGQLYVEAISRANKLYITHVTDSPPADTYFPTIGLEWKEVSREEHVPDEKNKFTYAFCVYKK